MQFQPLGEERVRKRMKTPAEEREKENEHPCRREKTTERERQSDNFPSSSAHLSPRSATS